LSERVPEVSRNCLRATKKWDCEKPEAAEYPEIPQIFIWNGGAEGDRTPDLRNAIAALSQLSYGPEPISAGRKRPAGW
jgi:hypothetical protein